MRRLRTLASEGGELGHSELTALSYIDRAGPVSIADLARQQDVTPQTMGATVASLENAGLVIRAADPGDRRRSLFTLTASGKELLTSGRGVIIDLMAGALRESFTPEEVATLAAAAPLIERLSHQI
jgi:DNA-binding MarR family transcriptional regulator